MALVVKDRVKETSTTTGTGTFTLAGASTGFQSFSVIGDGNTTYYTITDGTNFEVGIGTYTSSGTTLSRDTILESSNSGNAVNWGAGSKDVFVTYPAERSVYTDGAGTAITPATASVLGVAFGGTGATTLTSNNVILGNGTSAVQFVAPSTSGNVLTSNGTTWTSAAAASLPAGTVTWFAANTAPTGYLKANGATISRTTYADLFAAIGTTFGAGDGATTFGLPDLRGEFIRGWDDGRGVDSGRAFGSAQLDQMQQITGAIGSTIRGANGAILANQTSSGALSYGGTLRLNSAGSSSPATANSEIFFNSANSPSARTGSETRSRNVALLACIKF